MDGNQTPRTSPKEPPRRVARPSRAQVRTQARRERERRRRAVLWANELIRASTFEEHTYLVRKGFPDERGLVVSGETVNTTLGWDWVDAEVGFLLIAVRSARNAVQSVQLIAPNGEKRFLPGGQIAGGRYEISTHRFSALRWYVEGYMTGISVREALRELRWTDGVVVCFSDHNLQTLATADARALVIADHDQWKCPSCSWRWSGSWPQHQCPKCGERSGLGKPAGERAARASGSAVVGTPYRRRERLPPVRGYGGPRSNHPKGTGEGKKWSSRGSNPVTIMGFRGDG